MTQPQAGLAVLVLVPALGVAAIAAAFLAGRRTA